MFFFNLGTVDLPQLDTCHVGREIKLANLMGVDNKKKEIRGNFPLQ